MRIALGVLQVLDWAASFATPLTVLVMLGKFLERREGWLRLVLRYAAAWVMCNNVIYFGDYVNILYALPAVFLLIWNLRIRPKDPAQMLVRRKEAESAEK